MNELEKYGFCIRHLLQQKQMKAEELVTRMNENTIIHTNKSAISRIMTGKRMPTSSEAELLAQILEAPELLFAYQALQDYVDTSSAMSVLTFHDSINHLLREEDPIEETTLQTESLVEPKIDYELLYQLIETQYQYCLKQDVTNQIKDGFMKKLSKVSGFGDMIIRLKAMYQCLINGKQQLLLKDRAWLAVAILYFITPMDLIPDYFLPFGYVDDAVVVGFVSYKLGSILKDFIDQHHTDLNIIE